MTNEYSLKLIFQLYMANHIIPTLVKICSTVLNGTMYFLVQNENEAFCKLSKKMRKCFLNIGLI